ncbi:MAG TPA: TMEM165/GDT1 family protein [Candidatus Saccharimonadales bacterium]|nr:TMEM165/GDT1 family protein [Candidatus Saccharimonadales bacterium]
MSLGLFALVFAVIFVAELPDKSLFAALILGTRFPAWYVWLGASAAFTVHVVIAVIAGKFLTLLPHRALEAVVALLFLTGAGLLLFGKETFQEEAKHRDLKIAAKVHAFRKVFATAFTVTFIGEWGDITQITTANYAAKYHDPWTVGIAATLALWAVTAVAVTLGQKILTRINPKILQRITALVLLGFGVFSALAALR